MINKAQLETLGQALANAPDPEGAYGALEHEQEGNEPPSPFRRKGLVPSLEPGDYEMLRLLASWRFASRVALAELAWPNRTSKGQQHRMSRFVDCGILGRKRLRFAKTRHVVWARPKAIQLALNPSPPRPLVPPRFKEDAARHGWMRSVVAQAYRAAGWTFEMAETEGTILRYIRQSSSLFGVPDYVNRVLPNGGGSLPFDLAMRLRPDGQPVVHVLVVDDPSVSIDRLLYPLPLEVPRANLSRRFVVRFFAVDDFTVWSAAQNQYVAHSARALRVLETLRAAQWDKPPVENTGPAISPWLSDRS